ncbi:hypothetical protein GCM10009092_21430 [Bowmanella denitrificans]|uniref:Uncharacterized protein n=1 Tax=Bowmanella denitrificans TaxID=366582 RepID=A0ABN0X773_9ALTE
MPLSSQRLCEKGFLVVKLSELSQIEQLHLALGQQAGRGTDAQREFFIRDSPYPSKCE